MQTLALYNDQKADDEQKAELVDIGSGAHAVPNELTPRPHAQEGLTLAKGEVGEILLHLVHLGAITAYVFQRDRTVYPRNTADIKPLPDCLNTFIEQAKMGVHNVQWQKCVDELYPPSKHSFQPTITEACIKTATLDGYAELLKLPAQSP